MGSSKRSRRKLKAGDEGSSSTSPSSVVATATAAAASSSSKQQGARKNRKGGANKQGGRKPARKKAAASKRSAAGGDVAVEAVVDATPKFPKSKVLVFCTRGIGTRARHLMTDLKLLLPHHKTDVKMDTKDQISVAAEIAEMKGCNSCILFEMRKRKDLYLWFSKVPDGPSVKFHCVNIHTMKELNFTGNHLKGSRPLISFDANFDSTPHWRLLKEMLTQMFVTPRRHKASKPFVDHIFQFSIVDNRIWFRNYQIEQAETEGGFRKDKQAELVEVGPRFVLNPIRIFGGAFKGSTLYKNPNFISPNALRRQARLGAAEGAAERERQHKDSRARKEAAVIPKAEVDRIYEGTQADVVHDLESLRAALEAAGPEFQDADLDASELQAMEDVEDSSSLEEEEEESSSD